MCTLVSVLKELGAFIYWDVTLCNVLSVQKELCAFIYWDVTLYNAVKCSEGPLCLYLLGCDNVKCG